MGLGTYPFIGCPVSNCRTTSDRSLLDRSDAVIFHPINMDLNDMPPPATRKADQRWIFYNLESPNFTPNIFKGLSNVFNWTMTYRMDSDVYSGYDLVQSEETLSKFSHLAGSLANIKTANRTPEIWRPLIQNKKKKVAWFVSHCWTASRREKFVSQLRQFIDVDIYGQCGELRCPRGRGAECCNYGLYLLLLFNHNKWALLIEITFSR